MSLTLYHWPGRLLYVGPGVDTDRHAHHAHQITLGLEGSVCFELMGEERLVGELVSVAANTPHTQRARGRAIASLYLDPATSGAPPSAVRSRLPSALKMSRTAALTWTLREAWAASEALLGWLTDGRRAEPSPSSSTTRMDPRIRQALTFVEAARELPRSAELAQRAGMSTSRFTHLFSAEVGLPYRSYRAWVRIQRALQALAEERSLTAAAHDAGFSDSAHLSRTFRRMFGIAPSTVLQRARIVSARSP